MGVQFDILAFGACSVDDLFYVDEFPQPDGKLRVQERLRAGGGLAATALVAAARLGTSCSWCGVLGDDELSAYSKSELQREGVSTSLIRFEKSARPHYSAIIVDRRSGSRSILACHDGVTAYPLEAVTAELVQSCRVLFVDHHATEVTTRAATFARKSNIPVVADIERAETPGLRGLLSLIDHLILNLQVARQLTGETSHQAVVEKLGEDGRGGRKACCAVTDGANGCWFQVAGGSLTHQPAYAVEAVDTTGCGDVFHGAYMHCLARGESAAEAIRFASAVAALKAMKPGGRAGIPTRPEVESFLAR